MVPKKIAGLTWAQGWNWGTRGQCFVLERAWIWCRFPYRSHIPYAPGFLHLFWLHRGSDTGWHHLHGTYWYTVSLGPCKGLCMLWKIHKYVHLNAIIFLSALLRSYRSPLNILRLSSFNQQCQKNGKVPKWSAVNYYPLSCFWISWFLSLEKGKWERFPIPLPQENFLSKSSSWIMLHFS